MDTFYYEVTVTFLSTSSKIAIANGDLGQDEILHDRSLNVIAKNTIIQLILCLFE